MALTAARTRMLAAALAAFAALTTVYLPGEGSGQQTPHEVRAIDPVCNIAVRKNPELSLEYEGETYYFCMRADLEVFRQNPQKFLRAGEHQHAEPAND